MHLERLGREEGRAVVKQASLAAFCVAVLAVVMVWWPMSRTTAMGFAFCAGAIVGGFVVGAIVRRSE